MLYTLNEADCKSLDISTRREWILTNGLGGYASGTASGINTRRYHGLLVAATQPPAGREVLLAAIDAFIGHGPDKFGISSNQYPGAIFPEGFLYLRSFTFNNSATWIYEAKGLKAQRTIHMFRGANAIRIDYQNIGDKTFDLTLRPLVCHKPYHTNFRERPGYPAHIQFLPGMTAIENDGIPLVIRHEGATREPVQGWYYRFEHAREAERGLDSRDDLYCPCEFDYELDPGQTISLFAALGDFTPPIGEPTATDDSSDLLEALKAAARNFIVETPRRASIIAGYPWFTDWGRDTMVSLPGICLHTGRVDLARRILSDFGKQTFQGLIPNRFVEDGETPDYNTVDGTLWYANAIYKTLETEWDEAFAREMLAVLKQVYVWHKAGTLYGIKVDPGDGLLTQGERGVQLTWMDAKVGDWVVTPRHGKPVEVNGLWINMLRILEWLCGQLDEDASEYVAAAERAEQWFELKFFHEQRGHYVDTVDPLDVTLRPNQVIAMALPFGPAKGEKAKRALEIVQRELLTPNGLRTLGPQEMNYHGRFEGPLPQLDAAYHQGTAWPWLLGQYATAAVKINGDHAAARAALDGALKMLSDYGLGGIAEVYDGDAPQRPNGCPWQAWSVGELLRSMIEDAPLTA
jgi:glycogen debranching enzyme